MKTQTVQIVDCGRGPQLSTSRITVLDLIPYFQRHSSFDEIKRWLPTLTDEEIVTVEHYYREHQLDCDEQDRRARAYRLEQIRLQREQFPEEDPTIRLARVKELLRQRQQEANGEVGHTG